MRGSRFLVYIGGLVLVGGAATWAVMPDVSPKPRPSAGINATASSRPSAAGKLDGMTFLSKLGPSGKPADVEDRLIFADGTFVSTECDRRCGYPPAPYYVRRLGDKIEFVSESDCVRKDATLSWRGTIENGTIQGRVHWTIERWYWTIEKDFWFEGTLEGTAAPVVGLR